MPLDKVTLNKSLKDGLKAIFLAQSQKGVDGDDRTPAQVIEQISTDMAKVMTDAVEAYVKSGDIMVAGTSPKLPTDNVTIMTVLCTAPGNPVSGSLTGKLKME